MKALLTWFTISVHAGGLMAQTSTTGAPPRKRKATSPPPPPAVTVDDLNALKAAVGRIEQRLNNES